MKNKLITFETITSVRNHPNADRLDIVIVAGCEAVVGRDAYAEGQAVFFIHPDACLPADQEWAQEYLPFVSSKSRRVKAKKLRNSWSFGIVVPLNKSFLPDWSSIDFSNPDDLSRLFGVTKYDPPLPEGLHVKGPLPFGLSQTDEERFQTLNLEDLYGQEVDVTEKIDGMSITIYCNAEADFESGYCGRTWEFQKPSASVPENVYWRALKVKDDLRKLENFCKSTGRSIALRGEVCGSGVQSGKLNWWSKQPLQVRWFSAVDLTTLEYLTFNEFDALLGGIESEELRRVFNEHKEATGKNHYVDWNRECAIQAVPYLGRVVLTKELVEKITTVKTLENLSEHFHPYTDLKSNYFEGTVVNYEGLSVSSGKPIRQSFKIINMPYDEGKE